MVDPKREKLLVLLHGALGSSKSMLPISHLMSPSVQTMTIDFPGHGYTPLDEDEFKLDSFATHVVSLLKDVPNHVDIYIFGYSMGGYVASIVARMLPQRIKAVMTLGTKWLWTEEYATKAGRGLDPERIAEKVPAFAASLEALHHSLDWKEVVTKTRDMMSKLGSYNLTPSQLVGDLQLPILFVQGAEDETLTIEETQLICDATRQGEVELLPSTPHAIEKVAQPWLAASLAALLEK